MLRLPAPGWWLTPLWPTAHPMAMPLMPAAPGHCPWPTPDTQSSRGNTAQFPPDGLSTAPAAAAHRLRCKKCSRMSGCGTRIVLQGTKAPRTLRPLPLLRFAVSATGGAHLAAQSIICAFVSSRRTSLAVSALKLCGIASSLNFPTIAFLLNIDPIYKTGALWQQRRFCCGGQGVGGIPKVPA